MQRALIPPALFLEFCPFIILGMGAGPLYELKTTAHIFTKFSTYILSVDGQRI